MRTSTVYVRAAEHFGREAQLRQLQEECAELIVAINHLFRGRKGESFVVEEIADVIIMCRQMGHYFGNAEINDAIEKKLVALDAKLSIAISDISEVSHDTIFWIRACSEDQKHDYCEHPETDIAPPARCPSCKIMRVKRMIS